MALKRKCFWGYGNCAVLLAGCSLHPCCSFLKSPFLRLASLFPLMQAWISAKGVKGFGWALKDDLEGFRSTLSYWNAFEMSIILSTGGGIGVVCHGKGFVEQSVDRCTTKEDGASAEEEVVLGEKYNSYCRSRKRLRMNFLNEFDKRWRGWDRRDKNDIEKDALVEVFMNSNGYHVLSVSGYSGGGYKVSKDRFQSQP